MREAIVRVRDETGAAFGLDGLLGVFRSAGIADTTVLSCEGARGVVRVETETGVEEARLDELSAVAWWERVDHAGSGAVYVVEFDAADADAVAACADDVFECDATRLADREYAMEVAGPQDAIADTVEAYESAGADVELAALRDYGARGEGLEALTDRQREVVEVAFDRGYFDVPRTATTEDVAAELGVDPSTVSEHLQRAERNLVSSVLSTADS